MQSRFALSGLSLCLITIILLWISVVTRSIPRTSRSRAVCEFRHFVQAARNADVRLLTGACGLHSPRFLRTADISTRIHTPPPGKCLCVG
uniref:Secreted protein n=1 Tax=Ascaris lumbricoides TaxID=6252 RepID=A0A0M3HRD7_ASCLU